MFLSHSKKINNEKGDNELQGIESGYFNKLDTYEELKIDHSDLHITFLI